MCLVATVLDSTGLQPSCSQCTFPGTLLAPETHLHPFVVRLTELTQTSDHVPGSVVISYQHKCFLSLHLKPFPLAGAYLAHYNPVICFSVTKLLRFSVLFTFSHQSHLLKICVCLCTPLLKPYIIFPLLFGIKVKNQYGILNRLVPVPVYLLIY